MKIKYILFFIIVGIILLIISITSISMMIYSPEYMTRIIKYGDSDIEDYKIFPEKKISKGNNTYHYEKISDNSFGIQSISYQIKDGWQEETLEGLLEKTDTTAFIVIKDDQILYEDYFNEYSRESINTSFSTAKSVLSLLIGIAIDHGYIQSVEEPMTNYIKELQDSEFDSISIEDLLLMRSPIKYKEGLLWFGDDAKTYYMPDLRNLAIYKSRVDERENAYFHYNNYHPILLGIILERSTGVSVAHFMEKYLYQKLGAEFDASWSLDSEDGFEKMESGINARAIDFAKIGSLVLHKGVWNGETIISEEWLHRSTIAEFPLDTLEYQGSFLEGRDLGYGYMWYSSQNEDGSYDIFAIGKYHQIIYISPSKNLVIVRHGKSSGNVWWPDLLRNIVEAMEKEM